MSESVSRVYGIVVLALVVFFATGLAARASVGQSETDPVRLISAPNLGIQPQIATKADGSMVIVWTQREKASDTAPTLYVAQSPQWRPTSLITLPTSIDSRYPLAVAAGKKVHIAYSQVTTQTQRIWHHVVGEEEMEEPWEFPPHAESAFTVDSTGRLHHVWIQGNELHYVNGMQELTVTMDIDPAEVTDDLFLDVDEKGKAHLAWTGTDAVAATPQIYYAPLISGTAPVAVAQGYAPKLAVEASGTVHLCWRSPDGLRCASSRDWSQIQLIDGRISDADIYSLATGPCGSGHLLWTAEGALWYAHSVNWEASRRQISAQATMSAFDATIDRQDSPHLTWAALKDDADWDIFYQRPMPIWPQIAVRYPQGGEFLTHDTWAKAELNEDADDILRVEFYLEVDSPLDGDRYQTDYALRELGIDRNGGDGWATPLSIANLKAIERYRVMALATDTQGRTMRAGGGWFRAQPPDGPCTTLRAPTSEPVRGQSYVEALIHGGEASFERLHLYLAPVSKATESAIPLPDTSHYVGAYTYPEQRSGSAPTLWKLTYDARRFPDGRYVAVAIAADSSGRRSYLWPTETFVIDNAMAPNLEITWPRPGAIITGDELRVSATAEDVDGTIEQIDFYLEQTHPLAQQQDRASLEQRRLIWLGRDTDAVDGWGLRVPIDPSWHGGRYRIWATVFDTRGLQEGEYSTGTFRLLDGEHPYIRLLNPTPEHSLRGTVTIRALIRNSAGSILAPRVYLQNRDSGLTLLGPLTKEGNYFVRQWDTLSFSDGSYHLLLVGRDEEGHQFSASSDTLMVDNDPPPYRFVNPSPGQTVSGTIGVALESTSELSAPVQISLYYQDETGQLYPIAEGQDAQARWETTWNTQPVLDGKYRLIATLTGAKGDVRRLEQEIFVRNVTPQITFTSFSNENEWRGSQLVRWQTNSPLGTPVSTGLEYSADNGNSWTELASDIGNETSYLWDTKPFLDSREGRLRLSVSDGLHYACATSKPFMLNNVNEPPNVTLLAPKAKEVNKGQNQIAWQAWDPDEDPLTVTLAYRRDDGPWEPIASDISNSGKYVWDTDQLPSQGGYTLRVTARDSSGATARDMMEEFALVTNGAPSIRLLWPNRRTRLQEETAILWNATDPDDDALAIDIFYSDNAGQGWIPLAEGIPNTGFYEWQVSYLPAGSQYRVRVVARDKYSRSSDESDSVLAIGRNLSPRMTILSPDAAQTVSGMQPIRWTAWDPEGSALQISARIRPADSENWETLETGSPNDGLLLWDTTDFPDGEYDLRLVAENGQSSTSDTLTRPLLVANQENHAPKVRLLSPQGGETWSGRREVLWEAWDEDDDPLTATLSIRPVGESDSSRLAVVNGKAGRYVWDTQQADAKDGYMLRILVQDHARAARDSTSSPIQLTNEDSHPPHVQVLLPDEEGLPQSNIITWTAEDTDGDPLTVDLSINDDESKPWRELATGLYDAGEYVLDLPLSSDNTYRLRLRARDPTHWSEATSRPFTKSVSTKQLPEVTLEIPPDQDVLSDTETIRWQASDPSRQNLTVRIEISRDGGRTWDILERGLGDTGSYDWDTTAHHNGPCLLRLTVDNGRFETSRTSHPLVLSNLGNAPPTVSLVSPKGGEKWSGIQEIKWLAQDKDEDDLSVDLAYRVDGDDRWHTLASAVPNTGRYPWDTASVPNCEALWLRIIASDGAFVARDETDMPFAVNNSHTPLIELLDPRGGEKWSGRQEISWITARETLLTRVSLQMSTDAGKSWKPLASDLPAQGTYLWNTSSVSDRASVWLRVIADEYTQEAIDTLSEPVVVLHGTPDSRLSFYLNQ